MKYLVNKEVYFAGVDLGTRGGFAIIDKNEELIIAIESKMDVDNVSLIMEKIKSRLVKYPTKLGTREDYLVIYFAIERPVAIRDAKPVMVLSEMLGSWKYAINELSKMERVETITDLVYPVSWKSYFKLTKKGANSDREKKDRSVRKAEDFWKNESFVRHTGKSPRGYVCLDNKAEACLIALYGKRVSEEKQDK